MDSAGIWSRSVYWMGSFPNGRGDLRASDMDLIPTLNLIHRLERDFASGENAISITSPKNARGRALAPKLEELQRLLLLDLGVRKQRDLLAIESAGTNYEPINWSWKHNVLFRFGGLNQSLTLRVSAKDVYLIVYDSTTFTYYEIKVL